VTLPTVLRRARRKTPKSWNGNLRCETAEPAETSVHYSTVRCCHPQGLSLTTDNSEIDRRTDDKSNTALFRQIGSTRKSLSHTPDSTAWPPFTRFPNRNPVCISCFPNTNYTTSNYILKALKYLVKLPTVKLYNVHLRFPVNFHHHHHRRRCLRHELAQFLSHSAFVVPNISHSNLVYKCPRF
jgi:hypothetical protein